MLLLHVCGVLVLCFVNIHCRNFHYHHYNNDIEDDDEYRKEGIKNRVEENDYYREMQKIINEDEDTVVNLNIGNSDEK